MVLHLTEFLSSASNFPIKIIVFSEEKSVGVYIFSLCVAFFTSFANALDNPLTTAMKEYETIQKEINYYLNQKSPKCSVNIKSDVKKRIVPSMLFVLTHKFNLTVNSFIKMIKAKRLLTKIISVSERELRPV